MMELYVTRFTDITWGENRTYCAGKYTDSDNKIIYNSPVRISSQVHYNSELLVVELNNSTNKIMGVSIVRNRIKGSREHNMYSDNNYNRYSYYGRKRIPVEHMTSPEKQIMAFLETVWFKGKGHIKRGQGMSKINGVIFAKCREIVDIPLFVKKMFQLREKEPVKEVSVIPHNPHKRILLKVRSPSVSDISDTYSVAINDKR